MKHAREDYNRIQDPAGLIPEDEPVFLLRAQDMLAPATIVWWSEQLAKRDGDPTLVKMAKGQADKMVAWQKAHGFKLPDLPKKAAPIQPNKITVLIPTPGRIIHIFPGMGVSLPNGMLYAPAIVVQSWENDMVNCVMFITEGYTHIAANPVTVPPYKMLWSVPYISKKVPDALYEWYWQWPDKGSDSSFTIPRIIPEVPKSDRE
jgi:hypothetical protein